MIHWFDFYCQMNKSKCPADILWTHEWNKNESTVVFNSNENQWESTLLKQNMLHRNSRQTEKQTLKKKNLWKSKAIFIFSPRYSFFPPVSFLILHRLRDSRPRFLFSFTRVDGDYRSAADWTNSSYTLYDLCTNVNTNKVQRKFIGCRFTLAPQVAPSEAPPPHRWTENGYRHYWLTLSLSFWLLMSPENVCKHKTKMNLNRLINFWRLTNRLSDRLIQQWSLTSWDGN